VQRYEIFLHLQLISKIINKNITNQQINFFCNFANDFYLLTKNMKLKFTVFCETVFGQNLFVNIEQKEVAMKYVGNFFWQGEVEMTFAKQFSYSYFIKNEDNTIIFEDREKHCLNLEKDMENVEIFDEFLLFYNQKPFLTKPFTECYFRHCGRSLSEVEAYPQSLKKQPIAASAAMTFNVEFPALSAELSLGIIGSCDVLGNWNEDKFLPLKRIDYQHFELNIPKNDLPQNFEFKFVIFNIKSNKIFRWENGENRVLKLPQTFDYLQYNSQFRAQNSFKAAGVAVPVFSLRSENDWGVGEFDDLRLLADWAKQTEMKMIQILPINDTTATRSNSDSYPYSANSVYALHPMYLNLSKVGKLENKTKATAFEKKRKELNAKQFVDYENVNRLKWDYLSEIYFQSGEKILANDEFRVFFAENSHWLVPYTVFSCIRDSYNTSDFTKWGDFAVFDSQKMNDYAEKNQEKVGLYYFVQFHLAKQLTDVRQYLHNQGVALKGDLPIGISAQSVDAWISPELFNMDKSAGAPPDDFSETGQNWGFPTYNWENMAKNGYLWWKQRFTNMAKYFDAFRIDHILGFFRIWEVPKTATWGLLGYFNPALPLSIEQIEDSGIKFDKERMTQPFITQDIVNQLFGENAEKVKKTFFNTLNSPEGGKLPSPVWRGWGWGFKKDFENQVKLEQNFPAKEFSQDVLKNLLRLHCEVIFIEDFKQKNHFHPRISLLKSYTYNSLELSDKQVLEQIYNDYFFVRHEEFWKNNAMKKLPVLVSATDMLVCGEDLGMVPASVPQVMEKLHILSLEIQRMPKDATQEFVNPYHTPYFSVCASGTHDMSPIRAWWHEDRNLTQRFYNSMLRFEGIAPENCTPEIAEKIVSEQFRANSMFAILPLQDYFAMDSEIANPDFENERINNPENPKHFWCYRVHISLEQLLAAKKFNKKLKMCVEYNRN